MTNIYGTQPSRFFSKNGEDYLLWTFFGHKNSGFFLDIGAFDGRYISNTYVFELMGWRGICVEPNPDVFLLCRKNRPASLCIQAACTDSTEKKTIRFYAEKTGLLSTTLNHKDIHRSVRKRYEQKKMDFPGFSEKQVPATTVKRIVEKYAPDIPEIDFLSIDTEGNEARVIQGIDFKNCSIRVVIVEANSISAEESLSVQLAKAGGYRMARRVGVNLFFAKNQKDAGALASIPIRCRISAQKHPLVPLFTPRKMHQDRILDEDREKKSHGE